MIPIKDENPTKNKSVIRLFILIICSIVFVLQITSQNNDLIIYYFGFKPGTLFGSSETGQTFVPIFTLFTSMFMHGGWLHFLGNMLYLWIFADNVEDELGKKKFIIFYLLSGLAAALVQSIENIDSLTPMIGASGAIAGILGSYIYLFPRAKIVVLVPLLVFFFTIRLPAVMVLGAWFFIQFINLNFMENGSSNVAWLAHIGGFLFGFLFTIKFKDKKKEVKLGRSVLIKKEKGPWDV